MVFNLRYGKTNQLLVQPNTTVVIIKVFEKQFTQKERSQIAGHLNR